MLGFRPVATIRKSRTPFHLTQHGRAVEIVLDQAEGLGNFAEIEALAADRGGAAGGPGGGSGAGRELGLTEVEPRSYLRMSLEMRDRPPKAGFSEQKAAMAMLVLAAKDRPQPG